MFDVPDDKVEAIDSAWVDGDDGVVLSKLTEIPELEPENDEMTGGQGHFGRGGGGNRFNRGGGGGFRGRGGGFNGGRGNNRGAPRGGRGFGGRGFSRGGGGGGGERGSFSGIKRRFDNDSGSQRAPKVLKFE